MFLMNGCNTVSPPNRWQYQSNSAYKNFERYYLEDHADLAAFELERARLYAKQSADLTTLARIELSKCALNTALLKPFSCKEYENVCRMAEDPESQAYYAFLSGTITQESIALLPKQYQNIGSLLMQKNSNLINQEINKITPLTSRMIAAALAIQVLDEGTIENIISDASYLGYKYAVIVWMNLLIERTTDNTKRSLLRQKLQFLMKST